MSWITVGVAAVGAISGKVAGDKNRKKQKELDAFRKKSIKFSPWSGMGDPGAQNAGPQGGDAMLQGGMQGAMIGNSMSGLDFSGGGMGAAGNSAMVDPSMTKPQGMMPPMQGPTMVAQGGGSAGAMGGGANAWGGLQQGVRSMDPTKNLFGVS